MLHLAASDNQRIVSTLGLFPLLFVILLAIGKSLTPRLYALLIAEDSAVEYATFLAYMLASFVAVRVAIDLIHHHSKVFSASYGLLTVGLFVVGMEEISWGQRIFNIDTPALLEERNYKGELNFHNTSAFPLHNAFIIVGSYGALSRLLLPWPVKRRHPMLADLFTPPYRLCLYFLIPAALYLHYQYLYYRYLLPLELTWAEFYRDLYAGSFITGKEQEPIELLLGLGFLLFVLINHDRYRRGDPSLTDWD